MLPKALHAIDLRTVVYILGCLFIVRPLAIYLSLIGTNAKLMTRIFFGWFGPRGLATALFALLVTKELELDQAEAVLTVAINAVWISALLHGISANSAAKWYGTKIAKVK